MARKVEGAVSRRDFVRAAASAAGILVLGACAPAATPSAGQKPTAAPSPAQGTAAPKPTAAPTATLPPAPKDRVAVTFWHSMGGNYVQVLRDMATSFNESQTKYWVTPEYQGGYTELRDKQVAAVAAGDPPEVVAQGNTNYQPFVRSGALEALDDLIKGPRGLDLSDYYPVVEQGKMNGKYYQLPMGVSTPLLYYNPEMVKAAGLSGGPKTWDDLLDTYIPKCTVKEGGKTKVYGFSFLANIDWWWEQAYPWCYGNPFSDDEFNVYLDKPEVIDFLVRFQKAFQAGQAYIPTSAEGGAKGYFASGFAATMVESTGVLATIDKLTGDKFRAEVSYLPEGPKGRVVPVGGNGLIMSARLPANKREAGWEFIRWMQQPEQIVRWDKATGYLCFTKKASELMAPFIKENPRYGVGVEQLQWSRKQSTIQTVPRAYDLYYDAMLQVLQGGKDPKTLMPEIQKKVEAVLKEEGLK